MGLSTFLTQVGVLRNQRDVTKTCFTVKLVFYASTILSHAFNLNGKN